jgi:hypothetical protein
MQRRIETKTRVELVIEHVVWNVAAGAALVVMILVLLGSLQWLDQVAPRNTADAPPPKSPVQLARPVTPAADRSTELAAVNRPSG